MHRVTVNRRSIEILRQHGATSPVEESPLTDKFIIELDTEVLEALRCLHLDIDQAIELTIAPQTSIRRQ